MSGFWYEAGAVIPSICVGLLFWFTMRAMLSADRKQREEENRIEQELKNNSSK